MKTSDLFAAANLLVKNNLKPSYITAEFDVVDSLAQGLETWLLMHQGLLLPAHRSTWPDALPAATNDSYGYQWELNPRAQFTKDIKVYLKIVLNSS